MDYFFQDHLRWNLGWDTPNQAGAFVATLLPWLWWLTSLTVTWTTRPACQWPRTLCLATLLLLAAETAGCWALAKTYSRGALVAVLAAGILWASLGAVLRRRTASPNIARGGAWLALRGTILVGCVVASGFGTRLEPAYNAADHSVLNRLDLWRGGLQLVAASPLHGWGWDQSGASFMHWVQPVGRIEGYKSMVNSYLTVAVEGGLPILAAALALALFLLWLGGRSAILSAMPKIAPKSPTQPNSSLYTAKSPLPLFSSSPPLPISYRSRLLQSMSLPATAVLAAWLAAIFFSNLWIIHGLWVVPTIAAGLILAAGVFSAARQDVSKTRIRNTWLAPLAGAGALALVVAASLFLAGRQFVLRSEVELTRSADGTVIISQHDGAVVPSLVAILPSAEVLGPSYGQELRRWLLAAPQSLRLVVPTDAAHLPPAPVPVVAFGEACGDAALQGRRVTLVHPLMSPITGFGVSAGSTLLLPAIDLAHINPAWRAWAAGSATVEVRSVPGVAVDIRARWPAAILGVKWSKNDAISSVGVIGWSPCPKLNQPTALSHSMLRRPLAAQEKT